jgi:hypothetical protein
MNSKQLLFALVCMSEEWLVHKCHGKLITDIQIMYKCAILCFSTGIIQLLGLLEVIRWLKTYKKASYSISNPQRAHLNGSCVVKSSPQLRCVRSWVIML